MLLPKTNAMLRAAVVGVLVVQMALPGYVIGQQQDNMMGQSPAAGSSAAGADASGTKPSAQTRTVNTGVQGGDTSQMQPTVQVRSANPKMLPIQDRYRLVLDRFTYGPRPGDLDRIEKIGLSQWFSEQLNPWKLDDSALDQRLADYPAMQMSLSDLMAMFPNREMIQAASNRNAGIPGGPGARAIYNDQIKQYQKKRQIKKDANKPGAGLPNGEVNVVPLPKTIDEVLAMEPEKRFKELCKWQLSEFNELRKELKPEQKGLLTAGMSPAQVEELAAFNNPRGVVEAEEVESKLLRDVYSERQLQEVMVDFWLNHFNVYIKKSDDAPYYIHAYEQRSIRPYAMGKFEDLLISTAASPAMLNYLDAQESIGPHSAYALGMDYRGRTQQRPKAAGLNENYAREVMELHTVGVNGGYTQQDVTELAKVFTGWTVGKQQGFDTKAQAQFDPTKHEPGNKVVMGHKIKSDGEFEGLAALRMLANSPQCAHFISTKLAVRFVGDDPPAAMVDRMTKTFLETHGQIRLVLLAMVNSPEFFTTMTFRAKLKTPQEYVISAVRATGANVVSTGGLATAVASLGMPVFGMLTPNGYSMKAEAWNSTTGLVSRMNFALALATNKVQGVTTDLSTLVGPQTMGMSADDKTKALEARLLDAPVSAKTQRIIDAQLAEEESQRSAELREVATLRARNDPVHQMKNDTVLGPGQVQRLDTGTAMAVGLILGSPEFQRR